MGNMIALDHTIAIQLVNFLFTIVVLNYLLIKPVRTQIAARNSLIKNYTVEVEGFTADAEEKLSNYEKALAIARAEASLAREGLRAEGLEAEQAVIAKAHAETQEFLRSSREETRQSAQKAMSELSAQVDQFAAQALSKILN